MMDKIQEKYFGKLISIKNVHDDKTVEPGTLATITYVNLFGDETGHIGVHLQDGRHVLLSLPEDSFSFVEK